MSVVMPAMRAAEKDVFDEIRRCYGDIRWAAYKLDADENDAGAAASGITAIEKLDGLYRRLAI